MPSDEMVEKARALYTQCPACRENIQVPLVDAAADFARSAVRDAVRECIAVVEHFANDELMPEEWPEHGLVKREGRFDSGYVAVTCEHVASALRQKFNIEEK